MLQSARLLVLCTVLAVFAAASNAGMAYGHGCPAQGGCCMVGGACADIGANSPIYMMFAVVGAGAVAMMAFYGRTEQRRLGAIFNIFG